VSYPLKNINELAITRQPVVAVSRACDQTVLRRVAESVNDRTELENP
jgi:hypothetical protein